jgi:hypothetical protein
LNDLGFFAALQAQYYLTAPRTRDELIEMVQEAYENFPRRKINRLWLTLQSCLNKIIECGGDNTYKIPHMNKKKLEREGKLPYTLDVTDDAEDALELVDDDFWNDELPAAGCTAKELPMQLEEISTELMAEDDGVDPNRVI